MSEIEVIDRADIVRREVDRESNERALAVMDPAILDTMFASRDPKAIVQRIADVADVLMDAVHQRDLARRYGDNPNEFLHIEAWQFLSSMLGMTVVGVESRPLADGSGWEATAELRHVASGRVLGRRDAMCQKTERGREKNPPNTLRQMAQLRAARVAARSVLGFVPKIGGFEITDPEGPATNEQVGLLHQLEREIGMSHDEGHAMANVDSYKLLNREDASTLIDRWTAIRDELGTSDAVSTSLSGVGTEESPEPEPVRGRRADGAGGSSPACSHPSWKRSEGELRCTKCGMAKKDVK